MRDSGIVAIVQARMGSSRLPEKVLNSLQVCLCEIVLRRLENTSSIEHTNDPKDDICQTILALDSRSMR